MSFDSAGLLALWAFGRELGGALHYPTLEHRQTLCFDSLGHRWDAQTFPFLKSSLGGSNVSKAEKCYHKRIQIPTGVT